MFFFCGGSVIRGNGRQYGGATTVLEIRRVLNRNEYKNGDPITEQYQSGSASNEHKQQRDWHERDNDHDAQLFAEAESDPDTTKSIDDAAEKSLRYPGAPRTEREQQH